MPTSHFFAELQPIHTEFLTLIGGIPHHWEQQRYASVLLNRLLFIYFIQDKGFLDRGNYHYLQDKLLLSKQQFGADRYYQDFLRLLFFEGLTQQEDRRTAQTRTLLGQIPCLDTSLFTPHPTEERYDIHIPDLAFKKLFTLWEQYSWNPDHTPDTDNNEITPDIMGDIFERHTDQKTLGAYYTRAEITEYLCKQSIHRLVLQKVELAGHPFDSVDELLARLDGPLCDLLFEQVLPSLKLLDPACGSGAFLVAAMKTLITLYSAVLRQIPYVDSSPGLKQQLETIQRTYPSELYFIKRRIITDNLFGVDLMKEATEITRIRLFLTLVASMQHIEQFEPLPSISFNLLAGNALVGLLSIEQGAPAEEPLHLLLKQFHDLGIQHEKVMWNSRKNRGHKAKGRSLTLNDIRDLKPLHWGYEFSEIMNKQRGFDAILTNPPWAVFKPDSRKFTTRHQALPTDEQVQREWEQYLSRFLLMSAYFRSAPHYANQASKVGNRTVGSNLNLFKLFLEQSYNLLRDGGQCGIVIPSGIYTDLGTKGLRELLFSRTRITGLVGFENRKEIFEGVHRSYKFVVLTFEKGKTTETFPATFMHHDVKELARFPQEIGIQLSPTLIETLSPETLSIMEFAHPDDVAITIKMTHFPLLGKAIEGKWNLTLIRELDITNDRDLFHRTPGPDRLPLYEGKMIHQFKSHFAEPRFWIDAREGYARVRKRSEREGTTDSMLDYQGYRLGIRAVGRNTDSRTMIVGPIPKNVFCGNSLLTAQRAGLLTDSISLAIQGILNSLLVDYFLRHSVTANINMFYVYQIPVPRLMPGDPFFATIVECAARLICTSPEFDDLARAVGLSSHKVSATRETERAQLRAKLDGMVAHLYHLTEEEFRHTLTRFPLVDDATKEAALKAYRTLGPRTPEW